MGKTYTLAELAYHLDGVLYGDATKTIRGVASLSCAQESELSSFNNFALFKLLKVTQAGAVLLKEEHLQHHPVNSIVISNPLSSMALAAELFADTANNAAEIHPTALISASARLGEGVSVGANSIIGEDANLADNVKIGANCVLEACVSVGEHSLIQNGVVIHSGSKLGRQIVIESGAILGAAPFNSIKKQGKWFTGPAVGGVFLSDYVHVGANTIITRGALGDTFIGDGVHIDNLVMIAHDVIIGANSAVAGCATMGAYAQIGEHCIIGGASCIAAHVHLVDDVVITGMSTVSKSLTKPGIYSSGTMVCEHRQWRRNAARFRRLDDYIARLIKLEKDGRHDTE
ncbi:MULTISPECIES: UDP-3-O-(3-hydroxymyristoyl)glucosamine N-acyltransferase [unclassified Legionella]|uniref:UDP-3-O-(3-hydroxymyristoyl)glucosamine N-acyltransferase n=1 Tax=unclassified Legionella TaxID=2622702 RepID=UPI0010545D78|nr:UDP-3-O-(3-hydroxymyristoyl)glucosamine N-acyltransferase [Legionella sp. W10-070]MDI9817820.1 UDP-3-O-(3-hydroxymyristoyl)glucosamine N-acyltransferase [Legionella sp. PL877]